MTENGARWSPLDHLSIVGFHHLQIWAAATEQQAERALDAAQPMITRRVDGYLFTQALRQTLRAAQLMVHGLVEEGSSYADAARVAVGSFEAEVPDAKNARDVLDHFDDYARGLGNLSHPGVRPTRRVPSDTAARQFQLDYEVTEGGRFVLHFGELSIDVAGAQRAVEQLVSDLHATVGLVAGSGDESMASFEPYTEDNPAYVALAFFTLMLNGEVVDDPVTALRSLVTPESIPVWDDFSDARAEMQRRSITSKVDDIVPGRWAYAKLPHESRDVRQVVGAIPLIDARFLILQHRPDLGNVWRVHALSRRPAEPHELPDLPDR